MIALPSIAFGGFSGSAKDVTARQVHGRSILTVRAWPTGPTTNAQVVRRASLKKIAKSWQLLTSDQMHDWDRLAEQNSSQSVLGQKAEISGLNLFVRLNANKVMAGEPLMMNAPVSNVAVSNVVYSQVYVTPELIVFNGITHQPAPFKLVVKMSGSQSAGVSNGWSKTVIISPDVEDDWGEADLTALYLKTIGVEPAVGQKIFIQTYWLDTSTGFAGLECRDSVICAATVPYTPRFKKTTEDILPEPESHLTELDIEFSTGAPVIQFSAVAGGQEGIASSNVYLDGDIPEELCGTSLSLGRGTGDTGRKNAQSYVVWIRKADPRWGDPAYITFAHRGGRYEKSSEIFGPGVLY